MSMKALCSVSVTIANISLVLAIVVFLPHSHRGASRKALPYTVP